MRITPPGRVLTVEEDSRITSVRKFYFNTSNWPTFNIKNLNPFALTKICEIESIFYVSQQ